MATPRPAHEAAELAAFVQSCVDFRTNVSFTDVDAYGASHPGGLSSPFAVVLGTLEQLRGPAAARLPVHCPAVAEAAARVKEEGTFAVLAEGLRNAAGAAYTRVVVAAVPAAASRTNCPARPDAMAALLSAALDEAGDDVAAVDVFVLSPAAVPVAAAAARAGAHSFSAKKGCAARAYCATAPQLLVVFPAPPSPPPADLAVLAASVQLCQRLVDAPPCLLNTTTFADIARGYARALGVDVDVVRGDELCERGYGGLYAVGRGAAEPPHLVTLTYTPQAAARAKVALVGKGIVYDCGGLALKAANFMTGMKHDMAGAAAVFCGFVAAVRLRQPVQLACTLCLAENAIGPAAYRNDDIVVMKSGKTVEVNNTDAEGRIVLGDGVYHATSALSFTPDVLIDMATLTGAQGIATGHRHAALFANDADAEAAVLRAGLRSGDTCFPVLYCPEYHAAEFKSPHADMRNLMKQANNAGVSCGGHFVASHVSPDYAGKHVHVDLAFPVFNEKGATGFGVALLTEYLAQL